MGWLRKRLTLTLETRQSRSRSSAESFRIARQVKSPTVLTMRRNDLGLYDDAANDSRERSKQPDADKRCERTWLAKTRAK